MCEAPTCTTNLRQDMYDMTLQSSWRPNKKVPCVSDVSEGGQRQRRAESRICCARLVLIWSKELAGSHCSHVSATVVADLVLESPHRSNCCRLLKMRHLKAVRAAVRGARRLCLMQVHRICSGDFQTSCALVCGLHTHLTQHEAVCACVSTS